MLADLVPTGLAGRHVRLEPLALDHVDGLVAAASVDRSSYAYTLVPDGRDAMRDYVEGLLAARDRGQVVPFVQRRLDTGTIAGCTRFMEPRHWRARAEPDEIEIGGTWLAADAQRTHVNTEAKLLLLTHAFDVWDVWRVALCTDARNERSRRAIERVGATFEGILRSHRPVNVAGGQPPRPRDSALFSIVADEWRAVADRLRAMLAV